MTALTLVQIALAALSLAGTWLVGDRRPVGWLVWLAANLLGFIYFIYTCQPVLAALYLAYFVLCIRSIYRWRRPHAADA